MRATSDGVERSTTSEAATALETGSDRTTWGGKYDNRVTAFAISLHLRDRHPLSATVRRRLDGEADLSAAGSRCLGGETRRSGTPNDKEPNHKELGAFHAAGSPSGAQPKIATLAVPDGLILATPRRTVEADLGPVQYLAMLLGER